ncbi:MAG: transposon-transfer assisting family protein [Oscillospiraceae bacterium]|nr:transposon-transfer assisting family protein [Oscillospiraceae bacterium]
MNNDFTHDELSLMSIYNSTGTREGLLKELTEMHSYLDADESELLALTDSALRKLAKISDAEYAELDLYPEFD